jgi:hypothetical protein
MKAINTLAAVCMPGVFEKRSTLIPSRNPPTSNNHLGVSNGIKRIKMI